MAPNPWESLLHDARRAQAEASASGRAYYRFRLMHFFDWHTRYPADDEDHDPLIYYEEIIAYKLAECLPTRKVG